MAEPRVFSRCRDTDSLSRCATHAVFPRQYSAISAMLTVSDFPAAVNFCQKAFGSSKRSDMNADGETIHAELTTRLTWEMEKWRERANLRQIQLSEYSRGLRQAYSPFTCLTITSESE
jgi:hypothetical protein